MLTLFAAVTALLLSNTDAENTPKKIATAGAPVVRVYDVELNVYCYITQVVSAGPDAWLINAAPSISCVHVPRNPGLQ